MKPFTAILGLPIAAPLFGLGWLARRIAEAAEQEMCSAASIQTSLLTLERRLDDGEIELDEFETEEARLLEVLASLEEAPEPAE